MAVCGSIRCRGTTKWMREQNLRNARQPACAHRRVLCGRSFVVQLFNFQSIIEHSLRNATKLSSVKSDFLTKMRKNCRFILFSFRVFLTARNCHKLTNNILICKSVNHRFPPENEQTKFKPNSIRFQILNPAYLTFLSSIVDWFKVNLPKTVLLVVEINFNSKTSKICWILKLFFVYIEI